MHLPLIFFVFTLVLVGSFARSLRLFHSSLHFLHQLSQLSIFIILDLDCFVELTLFLVHSCDHLISLLEFLLNNFQLLWVSKGILRFDDLFKLGTKSNALVHVKFYLDFSLMSLCVLYIPFKQLYFFLPLADFSLKFSDFAFQVSSEMRFRLSLAQKRFILAR